MLHDMKLTAHETGVAKVTTAASSNMVGVLAADWATLFKRTASQADRSNACCISRHTAQEQQVTKH